jgi:hypothetical protein
VGLEAVHAGHGKGNLAEPAFVLLNAKQPTKAASFLCVVEGPTKPDTCGAVPVAPEGIDAALDCALCDPAARDRAWQHYFELQLAVNVLDAVLAMHTEREQTLQIAERLSDWLKAQTPSDVAGRALQKGLSALLNAANGAARAATLRARFQTVLDVLELSMTPDDLAQEGGLRATIKLASLTLETARAEWQSRLLEWSTCQVRARAAGKRPVPDAALVTLCNQRPHAAEVSTEARRTFGQFLEAQQQHDACLASTPDSEIRLVQYQAAQCGQGMAVANSKP